MTELKEETENKILDAAKSIFLKKGLDGARMQEIADEANISKALLHYYFRTKERLFEAIFKNVFMILFPKVNQIVEEEIAPEEIIRKFIYLYISMLKKHPYVPVFIIREINRDPDSILKFFMEVRIWPMAKKFTELMNAEIEKGTFRKVDPKHIILNIISMSIFPVLARPIIKDIVFKDSFTSYEEFMDERAEVIIDFVLNSLRP